MDFAKLTREEVYAAIEDDDCPVAAEVERLMREFAHAIAAGDDPHSLIPEGAPPIFEVALETVAVSISDQTECCD